MERLADESERLRRARGLPADALGVGLRVPHYAHVFNHDPAVDYFEVISENTSDPP